MKFIAIYSVMFLLPAMFSSAQQPAKPEAAFDTVSLRLDPPGTKPMMRWGFDPNGYRVDAQSIGTTILLAYVPHWRPWHSTQLIGAPDWVNTDAYAIDGHIAPEDVEAWKRQSADDQPLLDAMLRSMLVDRCHLRLHTEPIEADGLHLERTGRLKLTPADPNRRKPADFQGVGLPDGGYVVNETQPHAVAHLYNATMADVAEFLGLFAWGQGVVDRTGLSGRFDVTLRHWSDGMTDEERRAAEEPDPPHRWALGEIGLVLKPGKVPDQRLVIDHIERPTPN